MITVVIVQITIFCSWSSIWFCLQANTGSKTGRSFGHGAQRPIHGLHFRLGFCSKPSFQLFPTSVTGRSAGKLKLHGQEHNITFSLDEEVSLGAAVLGIVVTECPTQFPQC